MRKDDITKGEIMKRQKIITEPRESLYLGCDEEKKNSNMTEGILKGGEIKLVTQCLMDSFIHLTKDLSSCNVPGTSVTPRCAKVK